MGQSYKLRLGDGTVLVVDHAGLANWLADPRALVQPAGAEQWTPLRSFLIRERSAVPRAARNRPHPPSTSRDALPLVYPKPLEQPAPGAPVADAPEQQQLGTPAEAKEPIPVRADGLPLVPPSPKPRDDPDSALRRAVPVSLGTAVPPPLPKPPAPVTPTPPQAPPLPQTPPLAQAPALSQPPAPSQAPPPPIPQKRPDEFLAGRPSLDETPATPDPPAQPVERTQPAPATPEETAAGLLAVAEEPPSFSADAVAPAGEDVEWMTLPLPPGDEPPGLPAVTWLGPVSASSAGAPPTRLEEAPRPIGSRARPALGTLLVQWIDSLIRGVGSLAHRVRRATRLWLTSQAAAGYGALLALWNSRGRSEHPLPSSSYREPAPDPAVDSEGSAPLRPRSSVGAPTGGRTLAERITESLGVYRPRRSPHDGLPLLRPEAPDANEEGWGFSGGSGTQSSTDELPEIVLEPLDELPVRHPAEPPRLEEVAETVPRSSRDRSRDRRRISRGKSEP